MIEFLIGLVVIPIGAGCYFCVDSIHESDKWEKARKNFIENQIDETNKIVKDIQDELFKIHNQLLENKEIKKME